MFHCKSLFDKIALKKVIFEFIEKLEEMPDEPLHNFLVEFEV